MFCICRSGGWAGASRCRSHSQGPTRDWQRTQWDGPLAWRVALVPALGDALDRGLIGYEDLAELPELEQKVQKGELLRSVAHAGPQMPVGFIADSGQQVEGDLASSLIRAPRGLRHRGSAHRARGEITELRERPGARVNWTAEPLEPMQAPRTAHA